MIWKFQGVDGVNVQCPRALEAGVARIVGKRFDAATGEHVVGAPTAYDLDKRSAAGLRAFFAKCLRLGELLPADAATAADFGVAFKEAP